jgi:hypothetical protein
LPLNFRYNRRYVGTLGGQPVVLELIGQPGEHYEGGYEPPSYAGHYYFGWGGEERTVSSAGYRADQPLLLVERIIWNGPEEEPAGLYAEEPPSTGTWQAQQPIGPFLTGIWTDKATRRTTRFTLHEDYTGAVRYEEREARRQAPKPCQIPNHQAPGTYEDYRRTASWWGPHLLGPDTLRPAWQQLQCPVPQQVQQQLAALLAQTDCSGHIRGRQKSRLIAYNGDNLLSCTDVWSTITAAFQPSQHIEEHTYDLATGKECSITDWLRPNKLGEVQQLAVWYYNRARHYPEPVPGAAPRLPAKLPAFLLSSAGIAFRFPAGNNDSQEYSLLQHRPVTIPFAALAPYVRPGTPLARLVATRTQH